MMYDLVYPLVENIKQKRPLILNLTNLVTMDFIANGLLSLGASPIMSQAKNEINDLVKLANALVINIGTLDDSFISLCEQACTIANELNKPIIFDPVGAGASKYRTQTCLSLMEQYQFAIIRGNASEIMALCGDSRTSKGVDSSLESIEVYEPIKALSNRQQATIAVSGKTDLIVTNQLENTCERGAVTMPMITGSGCLLTAIISAFHAIEADAHQATLAAFHFYGACGERAHREATGPGSFKFHFLDALSKLPTWSDYETD